MAAAISGSSARGISSRAISMRARSSWWRTRNTRKPRARNASSARSIVRSFSSVGRFSTVLGTLELARLNDLVAQAEIARDPNRELAMAFRVAGAVGGDGDRAVTERAAGDAGQIRAVDAAAVGHDDRFERGER